MIKVCHITSVHARYDDRIFEKECMSLVEHGYEVHLVVNDYLSDEVISGVHIHSIKAEYTGRLERITLVNNIMNKALETDSELYHIHDPELLLIAKKLIKKGKKVVFDSHEYYYEQIKAKDYLPKTIRGLIAYMYKKYETYICKQINAVISICSLTDNNGKKYNPFFGRCQHSVYIANYPVDRTVKISRKERGEFKICHVGGLTRERGITELIDGCYLAGCRLILAGTFSSKEYQDTLMAKPSYSCVDYRGQCTTEEVFKIYIESDAGAATLLDYGQYYKINTFSVKVYEYFQMKLPVIISNYPYACWMNEKKKFGITVRPDCPDDIASAIIKLKNNQLLCEIMGNNGHELYKKELNWDIESQKLLELYKTIL